MYKTLVLVVVVALFSGCIVTDYLFKDAVELPNNICQKVGNTTVLILYQNNSDSDEVISKMDQMETEFNKQFNFIDIDKETGISYIDQIRLMSKGEPVVLIRCKAFIGLKPAEDYRNALKELYS